MEIILTPFACPYKTPSSFVGTFGMAVPQEGQKFAADSSEYPLQKITVTSIQTLPEDQEQCPD